MKPLVSREEALANGFPVYFTGNPCSRGHIAERQTANWTCVECKRLADQRHHEANAEGRRKQVREYRVANREKILKRNRLRYYLNREKYLDRQKEALVRFQDKAVVSRRRNARNQHSKFPEKAAARRSVRYALKMGRLTKSPCVYCGSTSNLEAHHNDYSRPLEVVWMCRKHHKAWHRVLIPEYGNP